MFIEGHNEDEHLDSLKKKDKYHFSIPFEYIQKNYGNDQYDIAKTYMEVDVKWNYSEHGYVISYYAPDADLIDPAEGNGNIDDFYESDVESKVLDKLASIGITAEALSWGTGRS